MLYTGTDLTCPRYPPTEDGLGDLGPTDTASADTIPYEYHPTSDVGPSVYCIRHLQFHRTLNIYLVLHVEKNRAVRRFEG